MSKRLLLIVLMVVFSGAIFGQGTDRKKNARPVATPSTQNQAAAKVSVPVYFYEFEKPEFTISKVTVAHDDEGLGTIRFFKKSLEEEFELPIKLSKVTLQRLQLYWKNVGFLESGESFQSELDYPHLGSKKLWLVRDGETRTTEFNWTDHKNAGLLTDEYRKIGYQYIWMFEIGVSRKNQPLESPRIMKALDSHIKSGRISDPLDMVPFLSDLSVDERIPLIARNHAKRLVKLIKKSKPRD
jgi:hypothetical protein